MRRTDCSHYSQLTCGSIYQEYLARSLTDKYSTLSTQMDKVIDDANAEISSLRNRLEGAFACTVVTHIQLTSVGLQLQQQELEKKNQELVKHFREKSKKHQQLQGQYQKIKQQQFAAGIESAADHEADDVLHAAAAGVPNTHQNRHGLSMPSRGGSVGSGSRRQRVNAWSNQAQGGRMHTARK